MIEKVKHPFEDCLSLLKEPLGLKVKYGRVTGPVVATFVIHHSGGSDHAVAVLTAALATYFDQRHNLSLSAALDGLRDLDYTAWDALGCDVRTVEVAVPVVANPIAALHRRYNQRYPEEVYA